MVVILMMSVQNNESKHCQASPPKAEAASLFFFGREKQNEREME
jgi:hypothetical protein